MPTVPTNALERAMRKQYLQWLAGLPKHEDDVQSYIDKFQKDSTALIQRLGGQVASLGALADFPVPKTLELSPHVGTVYSEMKQAAISAGITAGLNAKDVARQMLNAGMDKSYRRLERLARTETVSAYWKNSWDSIADLPLIVMVWGSEESKRTCDYCRSRDGLVIEDGNIRDHPNGRCTPIPTLRSRVAYKGTLQPDGSVFMDPAWGKPVGKPKPLPKDSKPTAEQKDVLSGKSNPAAPSKAQPAQQSKPVAKPAPLPVHEESYVNAILGQLKSGQMTVAKLKAAAKKASPLGQANAQVALDRYAADVALQKQAKAAAAKIVKKEPVGFTGKAGSASPDKLDWGIQGPDIPKAAGLSPEQAAAVKNYTTNNFKEINTALRAGGDFTDASQWENKGKFYYNAKSNTQIDAKNLKDVKIIDDLLRASKTPKDMNLYRVNGVSSIGKSAGLNLADYGYDMGKMLDDVVGKRFDNAGFTSTSFVSQATKVAGKSVETAAKEGYATKFPWDVNNDSVGLRITVPKGSPGLDITKYSHYGESEAEFLLPPNVQMRIVGHSTDAKGHHWLDVVADFGPAPKIP